MKESIIIQQKGTPIKVNKMLINLTIPSLILMIGSLLFDTRILFYLITTYNLRYFTWIQEGFLYTCTLMQVICLIMYLCMKPLKHFSYCYEFFVLPLFSASFLKQTMPFESQRTINSVRIVVFVLGWIVSFIMVINEYTRYPEEQSQTLIKISTNLRVIKLLRRLISAIVAGLNLIQPVEMTFFIMVALTVIQCYCFLTTFTFQNPFHEYLLMLGSFTSLISWIDFILFFQGYTNYAFVGEVFFILVVIFRPNIFQKALELKYEIFGQKNIQTKKITELLAVFVVMKQIILNQRRSLEYTTDFQNKMFNLLHKMVAKNKIYSQPFDDTKMLTEKDYMTEQQINFLKVMQKRLKQHENFIAYEFYLTTIVRKGFNFKNKALNFYYQRVSQKGQMSNNIFTKIEMKMLYHHLMTQLQQKGKNQIHHAILSFSDSLTELKSKIINVCKHQISVVNLFQNSSNVPIERYSGELIQRHEQKVRIRENIDDLNANSQHVHSGTFLYICLLYKIIFERQQIIIAEKILKNFVIPIAQEGKKSKLQVSQYTNMSIFVFSNKLKGLIINENEFFAKYYGRTVRSAQKSKKYISEMFLSFRQRGKHQELMEESTRYEGLQIRNHESYDCWINRKIVLKNDKSHLQDEQSSQRIITVIEKVKISSRIYYEEQQSEMFICTIDQVDSGVEIKLLRKDVQLLKTYEIRFQIVKQESLTQLDEKLEVYTVVIKSHQELFLDNQMSVQQSQPNVSENVMSPLDFKTLEHQKIEKIEKQYDKEQIQFQTRRKAIIFLLILPIISYCTSILMNFQIDALMEESKLIMDYEKEVFQKTLISEKYVGLNIMLFQMISKNQIPNSMCTKYGIQNLKKYTVDNLLNLANNNFDQLEYKQIQGIVGSDQLQDIFNSKYYQFFEFKDAGIWMSYVAYNSLTKSGIFQNANIEGNMTLNSWKVDAVAKAINVSELSYDGIYSNLRKLFALKKLNLQETLSYSLIVLQVVQTVIFSIVLYTFYTLISFKYNHILLLRDFKRDYVKKRVKQMDFIIAQIAKLQKNQIYDIHIDRLMNLKMTRQNQLQSFTFEELENLSTFKNTFEQTQKINEQSSKSMSVIDSPTNHKNDQEAQYLVGENETLKKRNQTAPIVIMLSFHRAKFIGLFVFFLVSGALNILHNEIRQKKVEKVFLMQDLLNDMGLLLVGMQDLLVAEVVKYKGEQIYASHDLNQLWIRLDIEELMFNKFQQKAFTLFSRQTSDKILYQTYCSRAVNKTSCEKLKGGVLTNGLSSLVGLIHKDYNSTWDRIYSTDAVIQHQICQKLVIFNNFTIIQYQANLIQGYRTIGFNYDDQQYQVKVAHGGVFFLLLLGIGIIAQVIIGRGRKVRAQVLSMETKINLYNQKQTYRPILNTMFYKQEKDYSY